MTHVPQTRPDAPNFAAWSIPTLVSFAQDAYAKMQDQEGALEQLRLDLKDAMRMLRARNMEDDWK